MDAPYQWTKQVASHWGGTPNGTIVHWPRGITGHGGTRTQFCHFIDVAPTVLEAAGIPEPAFVNGVQQSPMEGTSLLYSLNDAAAPERHDLQYFEMFGNRGVYYKGWSAVTKHRTPWEMAQGALVAFDDDVWELYDGSRDWSQAHDLAREMPSKLHELQRLWLIEAVRYGVLPIDDRAAERLDPANAGRPTLIHGNSQIFYGGMSRLSESSVVNIKNKSHSVTAEVEVPDGGANGVIVAQGGSIGGWALYAHEGRLKYCYNLLGVQRYYVESAESLNAGEHQVRLEFAYDGDGLAKGGTASLYIDGAKVGEGRIEHTVPLVFSADETADVGSDTGTAVTPDYSPEESHFNGTINWVQIDVGVDDQDHLISPEERLRVAMARQ
jgi:arylsulfatase